ncbi:MAG: alpha/beta fold hydrolase [Spirochaetes bacterium]|nr:alpha/beta fold hydrolase [Spirochaetota bacterium]
MNLIDIVKPISYDNKSDTSVLCIHGYSGTNLSMLPLIKGLNKAGFNVEAPVLRGHGTVWQESEKVKFGDWLDDVENAYIELKKKSKHVFLAGLSMGGTLACYLAGKYSEIKGAVLINHAIYINDPRLFLLPVAKFFLRSSKGVVGDIKKEGVSEPGYEILSTKATHEFIKLIDLVKKNLYKVKQPLLIFKSKEDHVIKVRSVDYTLRNISSENVRVVWLENSYHVATLDNDADLILKKTIEFIKKNLRI